MAAYSRRAKTCVLAVLMTPAVTPAAVFAEDDLAAHYGFEPIEVLKQTRRAGDLRVGDFDGDGTAEIAITENGKSRVEFYGLAGRPADEAGRDVNEAESTGRFGRSTLAAGRRVRATAVGDFDGDGVTDFARLEEPDTLLVSGGPLDRSRDEAAFGWTARLRIEDADDDAALAVADLDGDDADELVVAGGTSWTVVRIDSARRAKVVSETPRGTGEASLATGGDLDGDGRDELCYLDGDDEEYALCVRRADAAGRLGPERRFAVRMPRSLTVADVDGRGGEELLTIDPRSGRWTAWGVAFAGGDDEREPARFVRYGFPSGGSSSKVGWAVGDFDGDGRADVAASDPDSARVTLFRQRGAYSGGGLRPAESSPSLLGCEALAAGDFDGDGVDELAVLSEKERVVGVSRYDGGRLGFPEPLPGLPDENVEPIALAANGGRLVVLSAEGSGRKRTYAVTAWRERDGVWESESLSADLPLEFEPRRLVVGDLDGDGDEDLLAIAGRGRDVATFVAGGTPEGETETDAAPDFELMMRGIGPGAAGPEAVALAAAVPAASPVFVASGAFARVLRLTAEGWEVAEQINGRAGSDYRAIVVGDFDGEAGPPEVAVVDRGAGRVSLRRRGVEAYETWRDVELGDFAVAGSAAVDLDGDGRDDVLLVGGGELAVLYSGSDGPSIRAVATHDPSDEEVFYFDSVAGDLNGDGVADVTLFDGREQVARILDVDTSAGARPALSWKLFEEKSFSKEGGLGLEPRESAIADVTGDGREDLILLIHDRILIYPQQTEP